MSFGPTWRQWHWMTLWLRGFAGFRYRPRGVDLIAPDEPAHQTPVSASWLDLRAGVAFHW